MRCARCLLQLNHLRLLGQSLRPAAQSGALLHSASSSPPSLLQNTQHQVVRRFHGSPVCAKTPVEFFKKEDKNKDKSLVIQDGLFEQIPEDAKSKATFNKVINYFVKADIRRRGHVEFIYAALRKMPEFGVERDLDVYNKLLDVFPKEVFVPRNYIQRMFNHYPRQQECGVQVLEQMENYGILPNVETKVLLVQIFGEKSHPVRKYQRLMYWFPKFKNLDPYPVPTQLPEDPVDLARLSLKRIANDKDAQITIYQLPCTDITESGEEITQPHIVGVQSPNQMELLSKHDLNRPVFVEGPFPLWLRKKCVYYYILRADPIPAEERVEEPYDPERCFDYPLQLELDLYRDFGDLDDIFDVDEVDEGPVYAMCMTSQGDQSTLNQWITGLQDNNPILGQVPTLFRLEAGPKELQRGEDSEFNNHQRPDPETRREEEPTEEEGESTAEEKPRRNQGMKQ